MDTIILTKFGEALEPIHADTTDQSKLPDKAAAGIHAIHSGFIYCKTISEKYFVIYCAICGRIGQPIPREVDTYGKLRKWCRKQIAIEEQREAEIERAVFHEPMADGPIPGFND